MNIINEKRTFNTIRLTDAQKEVLTKVHASATEKLAAEAISTGRKMITARDILAKLGMIEYRDGYAAITPDGEQIMKDYNLTDEMGELTSDGSEFAFDEEQPMESLLKQINTSLMERVQYTPEEVKLIVDIARGVKDMDDLVHNQKLYDKVYDDYEHEMPYGTRTGDDDTPDNWMFDNIEMIASEIARKR